MVQDLDSGFLSSTDFKEACHSLLEHGEGKTLCGLQFGLRGEVRLSAICGIL